MPSTFFGYRPRQKIDQKRRLSGRLSRIHFCDLVHGGGLVFVLHVIVASLAGRDTYPRQFRRFVHLFQPTRPLRDATLSAPRAYPASRINFNPRVPCGTRLLRVDDVARRALFQPTRPLRDATRRRLRPRTAAMDFNPRVPCGTRQAAGDALIDDGDISTHASLAGRDDPSHSTRFCRASFQPTRPLRDATLINPIVDWTTDISTHASLAGRDRQLAVTRIADINFNPRVPCGTRPTWDATLRVQDLDFNPRVPCGTRRQARNGSRG